MCVALACGCASDTSDDAASRTDLVALPDGEGWRFRMVTTQAPGVENEMCQLVEAPPEGFSYNRQEVDYDGTSHHVLLFETALTELPDDVPQGAFECDGFGDFEATRLLGGAQDPSSTFLQGLPEGVAIRVPPGAILLMNTHFINTTDEEAQTETTVDLYTVPQDEVTQEAGVIFWFNWFADLQPQASASSWNACPITRDVTLLDAQSHMHARGVNFVAETRDAPRDGEGDELYASDAWEYVQVETYPEGVALAEGSWVSWQCDYENVGDEAIGIGPKSSDEMCMFVGAYYPRDPALEWCSDDGTFAHWMRAAELQGQGTLTCAEAATCAVESAAGALDDAYQACILSACPEVSAELSTAVRCDLIARTGDGPCAEICVNAPPPECQGCIFTECGDELSACIDATCD